MKNTKLIQLLNDVIQSNSITGELTEENGTKALIIDTCNKLKEAKSILMQQGEPMQEHKSAEEIAQTHIREFWNLDKLTRLHITEAIEYASQFRQEQTISEEEIHKMAEKFYKEYSESQHKSNEFDFTVGFGRGFKAGMGYSKTVEPKDDVAVGFADYCFNYRRFTDNDNDNIK